MRRFTADYLEETRRGMWADRSALASLQLPSLERVLDVGCGTGELTRVLCEETPGEVVAVDADPALLAHVDAHERVLGDATRLPVRDDAFDLVVCQALLINLPDPGAAVGEFARVSSDLVAVVEPDNAAVSVESSVDAEPRLARRAREAYIAGVETDVTLGAAAADLLADAGFEDVTTTRHDHVRIVESPYDERDLEAAARKATADRLGDQRATMLAGDLDSGEYDELRADWREMGRTAVEQMREGDYERRETTPFFVTVGRAP
ncbi:class I SAM-dependent methyltransferase [Halobacterium zhouii]|uniref:class I SAM-dependent methyltransferase n=1 Tax=Halobacterium zhouii TaxID=2902624 RepID=UPI001E4E7175|nr:class I SAM-dependent methyltransferase [Halobacterium zhouii]